MLSWTSPFIFDMCKKNSSWKLPISSTKVLEQATNAYFDQWFSFISISSNLLCACCYALKIFLWNGGKRNQALKASNCFDKSDKWQKSTIFKIDFVTSQIVWFSFCLAYLWRVLVVDYRCELGRYSVSVSCVTISNPDSLFSSETGVNSGRRRSKSTHLNELDVRKPLVVSMSQRREELRRYNLVHNLTISNPGLKAVSSNASRGSTVRLFGGDDRGFLKESQDLSNFAS